LSFFNSRSAVGCLNVEGTTSDYQSWIVYADTGFSYLLALQI